MTIKKNILSFWKSIGVICTILYLSFTSPSTFKSIPTFPYEDKICHFIIYFILTMVLTYDYGKAIGKIARTKAYYVVCVIFPILLGGVIEISQPLFFAPRTASALDWLSNIAGSICGWAFYFWIEKKQQKVKRTCSDKFNNIG